MATGSFIHLKGVLSKEELEQVRALIGRSQFKDGRNTASGAALEVKHNEQLTSSQENVQLEQYLLQAFLKHPMVKRAVMPKMYMPPLVSRYAKGMHYGTHVDSPLNGRDYTIRTDVGLTLFLNEPEDYEGGELEVMTAGEFQPYKLPAGDAICYPTTQLHRVNPVTLGERLVAVTWMQCVVRDAHKRDLIFQTSEVIQALEKKGMSNTEEHLTLQQVYSNLIRLWAEL
jgi:PKHD-type hydroxylase